MDTNGQDVAPGEGQGDDGLTQEPRELLKIGKAFGETKRGIRRGKRLIVDRYETRRQNIDL